MKKGWETLMRHKAWLVIVVVAVIAVKAGLDFYAGKGDAAAVTPKLTQVERGDIVSQVAATGTIQPVNQVEISSKITGQLKEVRVAENETVKTGQVLVVLDDTRLKAQVTQAREKLNNTAVNFERNNRLHAIGAVSEQQLDNSRMDYNVASANYDEVVSQLDESVITSPLDGVVIGKPLPAGQMVAQGISNPMVILTIADMSKMQIEAQVDESDIGKVAVGQTVSFTVDTYQDRNFSGVVSKVSQQATTTQNVVYYTVTIDIDDAANLKPSMTARLSIQTGESKNTLTVPLAALKTNQKQQHYVVAFRNGKQEDVLVATGLNGEDRVEILSGVAEGEQIVLAQAQAKTKAASQQGGMPPVMGGGRR
ncbi:MAG: efflux RND transporter periplasmic adaptor subunit [Sporomusaceae bacterium]|nr:efflux RND transporter periplasmic adaptor subunit [Sporomusaceae bacterium]